MILGNILIAFSLAVALGAPVSATDVSDPTKPNIIFILADDWGWGDLGCHGHSYLKTPNLDRLATQGTDFRQFTVGSGVCSPSRTAIMTGHFPARHGVHGHFATVESHRKRGMPDWLDPELVMLPRLLQQAGYRTAHFGKWHLTNIMVPDAPSPSKYGYDSYGAFNCSGEQMPVHDDVKNSIRFIEEAHAADKPFFLNLWIHEPHTPHYPKPRYLEKFAHLESEADRIYAAVLADADARIGELLAALERLKLSDKTLVVFSSDNGPENTGSPKRRIIEDESTGPGFGSFASVGTTAGRRGRKRSLFQGGIGVPFIARWSGKIAAGKTDDVSPITAVDLLPTFCGIAGARLPTGYQADGVDQTAVLCGEANPRRAKPIFWQWRSPGRAGDRWPTLAVWDGEWKMLIGKRAGQEELFRFPADGLEKNNQIKAETVVAVRLRALAEEWKTGLPAEANANCFSSLRKSTKDQE